MCEAHRRVSDTSEALLSSVQFSGISLNRGQFIFSLDTPCNLWVHIVISGKSFVEILDFETFGR